MSRQGMLWICLHCFCFLQRAESNSFLASPGVVRGDVTGSAALEWTLESEPGSDDAVGFTCNRVDVFRYIPYTGVIPPPVAEGAGGNKPSDSYDPRFTIYNTSTRGVGFRLAGLRLEDAETYTCGYESLSTTPITMAAVLFVYDFPGRPVIEANPETLVDGVTTLSLECRAPPSTSLPVAHRPAMLYTWSRSGVYIHRNGPPERHAVLGDREQFLEISPVHHTDTTYTCTASESGTQLTSEETNITLDILHGPYNLTTNPEKPSARENDSLEITASADCNPACNFTWSIGDDVIRHGPLLKFDTFQLHDAINYTVRAANIYETADLYWMDHLTVEVTLDTSVGEYTVPGGGEVWTTDGVTVDDTLYGSPAPSKSGGKLILPVVSAVAGGLVLLIIIIVVAVCCARRRRKKKDDAPVEDLVLDGSTTSHGTRGFANGAVAADQGNALYAEVNKTKKGKKDKTEKQDETNGGPEPVLYAQVDKNRPRKGKDKAKENGQRAVPDELTVPVPSHYDDVEGASAPHPDHVTSVAEDPYTDIASARHGYSNTEQGQGQPLRPPKKVKGFTYSELTFARDTEARPEVIHSKEPPTQYSEVDFSRTAPPRN